MIKVIHKKDSDKYEKVFYVGRGSPLGNPYTSIKGRETKAMEVVDSREESISKFRKYLQDCIENKDKDVCDMLNQIYKSAKDGDVYLACYCKPKSCHGDVIKEFVDKKLSQKNVPTNKGTQLTLFGEINKD